MKKAEKLNKMNSRYEIKSELNENFYIDIERKCPVPPTFEYSNAENYLKDLFKSYKFFKDIKKYYINDIDEFVREYNLKSDSFSLNKINGFLSIYKTVECLALNEKIPKVN